MESYISPERAELAESIASRTLRFGVVGLGYVGLPLAVETARAGFRTTGFDVSRTVVEGIMAGESHIRDVPSDDVNKQIAQGRLIATNDFGQLANCDVISICVPTPLNKLKDPDLSFVVTASKSIRDALRPGQVIVLESTTFPGTTRDVVLPILEESGLNVGPDFLLCYSPERVDPGNEAWHTKNTPKVLGGITEACAEAGATCYGAVFDTVVRVSSAEVAELTKVYENTFRLINIALVNELAQACDKLKVDVWEVIEAAATKPFGFMKFTPGPGLGGHCIPLDPHYLSWKMRSLAYKTRMIDLASEINAEMPAFVVRKMADALNANGKPLNGSQILVLGVAYKRDVDDLRESPALEIIQLLQEKGCEVIYHDPYCPVLGEELYSGIQGLPLHSSPLTDVLLREADAVVVVTDHTNVDYRQVAEHAQLVIDSRGVMREFAGSNIIGLSGQEPAAVKAGMVEKG